MTTHLLSGCRIAGVAAAQPERVVPAEEGIPAFGAESVAKLKELTGVAQRRVVAPGQCASDLCHAAAEALLEASGWDRASVDTVIFVSQTPDQVLPSTSCLLHGRLGLSKACAAFDVNLGCSGYAYGLWLGASLVAAGSARRVLLLAGDTISRLTSPGDRSTAPLFGDAGSATLLEAREGAGPWAVDLGSDGTGAAHIQVPAGGFRTPAGGGRTVQADGNLRGPSDLHMDGGEVFNFTLREIPPMLKRLLAARAWEVDTVDRWVFHQANRFMLQHLAKKVRVPLDRLPIDIDTSGNTSVASIPLCMVRHLGRELREGSSRLVLAGFGVGFSWGALALEVGPCVVPDVVILGAGEAASGREA